MDSQPAQGIQVDRQGGGQGFSLTGLHLGDLSLVENHSSDELHVEVPLAQGPAGSLPDYGKGFDQEIIQGLTLGETLPELPRLGLKLGVAQFQ